MVAAGVRHTRALAARHETQVELRICQDVLKEYQSVNGYKNILGDVSSIQTGNPIQLPAAWITGPSLSEPCPSAGLGAVGQRFENVSIFLGITRSRTAVSVRPGIYHWGYEQRGCRANG